MAVLDNETSKNKVLSANPRESRKFASDIIWYSIAQLVVSVILGVVTLPALTKTYGPEIYGIWIQVTVTVDLISPLLSLQLGLAAVRYLAGEEDRRKRRLALGAMLSVILIAAVIVCTGGIFLSSGISSFLFNNSAYVPYVYFLILWVFFNSIFNFLLSYLRARSKIKEISFIQIGFTALKMAAVLVLAAQVSSLEAILVSMVTLQVLFALGVLLLVSKEVGWPILNFGGLRKYLAYGLPQMPVISLLWVIGLSDRYFLTHYRGLSDTGIFSSSSMIASLVGLLYFPISYVLFPQIMKFQAQNRSRDIKSYVESSFRLYLTLAIPLAAGITIVSQPLLKILSTSEFQAGKDIVLLLAAGSLFLGIYQINTSLLLSNKEAKWLAIITATGCVTSVMLNFIMIPRMGMLGAAISNCISYVVLAGVTTLWARRIVPYGLNYRYLGKVVLSTAVMTLSLVFLKVESIFWLIIASSIGLAVFTAGLLILRAFSRMDKQLVGKMLGLMYAERADKTKG